MKPFHLFITLCFIMVTACAQETKHTTVLERSDFEKAISSENVKLVDVRTSEEFKEGHIEGAQNIDFFQESVFQKKFEAFNKNEPIYLYCRSGNRSGQASKRLEAMGFTKIYDLKGGYLGWIE